MIIQAPLTTAYIQVQIDAAHNAGGGTVEFAPGVYTLHASTLLETYDNAGVPVEANTTCLVLRAGVRLKGYGAVLRPASPTLHAILAVSPDRSAVEGFEIDAGWCSAGAGHGVLQVVKPGEPWCRNVTLRDLHIRNVGSYAIGIQNGDLENLRIENVRTYNTGADGIDIKTRSDARSSYGLFMRDIFVEKFGQRLDGQAGVDLRGKWLASNIYVKDAGRVGFQQFGIRFRTMDATTDPAAEDASLDGFAVEGNGAPNTYAVLVGSRQTKVSRGTAEGLPEGVLLTGNSNGIANGVKVANVEMIGCTGTGFKVGSGITGAQFTGCSAPDCGIGFRNEGVSTQFVGCSAHGAVTKLSTSAAALPTQIQAGNAW
jgi:hypothetical protein